MIGVAVLVVLIPGLITGNYGHWFYQAMVVLPKRTEKARQAQAVYAAQLRSGASAFSFGTPINSRRNKAGKTRSVSEYSKSACHNHNYW
jgi:hypothetical protein